jgi:hypothetical protein
MADFYLSSTWNNFFFKSNKLKKRDIYHQPDVLAFPTHLTQLIGKGDKFICLQQRKYSSVSCHYILWARKLNQLTFFIENFEA